MKKILLVILVLRTSRLSDAGVALHSNAVSKYLTLNNSNDAWNNGIRSTFCLKKIS